MGRLRRAYRELDGTPLPAQPSDTQPVWQGVVGLQGAQPGIIERTHIVVDYRFDGRRHRDTIPGELHVCVYDTPEQEATCSEPLDQLH